MAEDINQEAEAICVVCGTKFWFDLTKDEQECPFCGQVNGREEAVKLFYRVMISDKEKVRKEYEY